MLFPTCSLKSILSLHSGKRISLALISEQTISMDSSHDLGSVKTNGTTTIMSATAEIDQFEPKVQVSQIYYIAPLQLYSEEKPFFLNVPMHRITGARQTNVKHTARNVTFTDIRSHECLFSLHKNGFEISKMTTNLSYEDFANPKVIVTEYFDEVKTVLASATGAELIMPWDYQVWSVFVLSNHPLKTHLV